MPIFDGFTDDEVDRIKNAGTFVTLPADWSPIWEKTPADKAYILLSGEVSVRRGGEEIARLGPGDIIGEAAIVEPLAPQRLDRQPEQARGAPLHQRRRPRGCATRSPRSGRRSTATAAGAPGRRRVGRVSRRGAGSTRSRTSTGRCSAPSPAYTRARGRRAGRRTARGRRGALAAARLPARRRRRRRLHRRRRRGAAAHRRADLPRHPHRPTRRRRWCAPGGAASPGSPSGRSACSPGMALEGDDPRQRLDELMDQVLPERRGAAGLHLAPPPRERRQPAARRGQASTASATTSTLAVGFVDIVGYTGQSKSLTDHELVDWVEYFEDEMTRLVVEHGGRVIKTIGDEILFVADDPRAAAEVALAGHRARRRRGRPVPAGARRDRVRRGGQPARRRVRPDRQHRRPG